MARIVTHFLAFEGNSQVKWFEGNYANWVMQPISRIGLSIKSWIGKEFEPPRPLLGILALAAFISMYITQRMPRNSLLDM